MPDPLAPPGLVHLAGAITPGDEDELLAFVDAQPWRHDLKRRTQHYGWRYDYTARTVMPGDYLGPPPAPLQALAHMLHARGHVPDVPDQCIVNEYEPGQGVAAHIDRPDCFGATIAIVSLGSACVMTLRPAAAAALAEQRRLDLVLEPRDLLVLAGEARYEWTHGIAARRTDRAGQRVIHRTRRVSVTFRTLRVRDIA